MADMLGVLLHDEEQATPCHFTNVAPCYITFVSHCRNLACMLFACLFLSLLQQAMMFGTTLGLRLLWLLDDWFPKL